jgi:hypothetical protein
MRTLLVLLAAALAVPSFAAPALAQTAKSSSAQKMASTAPHMKSVSGQVVSLDDAAKTLTVKQAGKTPKELTFAVAGAAAKSLTGLKAGDRIRVRYTDEAGKLTAENILKSRSKAKL